MRKRKFVFILIILLLIALCAIGSSNWVISSLVSFAPSLNLSAPLKIPVYINKVVEFDYGSYPNGVNLKENIPEALKFKNSAGEIIDDITLSTNILDENKIGSIPNETLTVGNTYAYNSVYVTLSESSNYYFAGTYTDNGQNFTTQSVSGTFRLLVKYQTVQIGSGSITTNSKGTETKINSFTSDSKWYTIEDALSSANSSNKIVKVCANTSFTSLSDSVTGYSNENGRTIKSGVTLAMPFDGTTINNTNNSYSSGTSLGKDTLKKLELTIPDNKTITNNGTISLGGSTTGGAGGGSDVSGGTTKEYAQISIGANSVINSNGDINAYGFIVEESQNNNSQVIMNSGTLLMPFIVVDHRGGSAFAGAQKDLKGAPFNRYYMQNVTPKVVIESGAKLHGWANLCATSLTSGNVEDNTTAINYIGNTSGYFLQLGSGSKSEIKYDKSTKVTTWDVYGNANINALQMEVSSLNVNTGDIMFPITWLWNVTFKPLNEGGTSNVTSSKQSLKIMPGGVLTIGEGVTFNIPQMYVYDGNFIDPWKHNYKYETNKGDGKFDVGGTLNIQNIGGYVNAKGDNAHLNISGGVTVTTFDLETYTGSSLLAKATWHSEAKSLEGPIYCCDENQTSYTIDGRIAKGNYTSLNDGWLTDDSRYAIIYNFVYRDSDGNEITPDDSGNPNNPTYHTKEDLVLKDATLNGFEFNGWYTSSDFATVNAIETINGNTYYRQTVTLYGLFKKLPEDVIQCTVNYVYNATVNGEEGTVNIFNNTELNTYNLITLSQTGYTLEGWYKDSAFTTKVEKLTEDDFVDNSITLYAKWEVKKYTLSITKGSNLSTFTVKVEYNGTTQEYTGSTSTTVEHSAKITITATPKTAYKLSLTVNGADQASGYSFTVSGNVEIKASAAFSVCLVEGTLVTLADGSQKKVEDLTYDDLLLVFNHTTGQYEASPMWVNAHAEDGAGLCRVIYLTFSDGTRIGVITEHAFFDMDLNKYVYIGEENAKDFINHRFAKLMVENDSFRTASVTLTSIEIVEKIVRRFSPVAYLQLSAIVEGLWGVTECIDANYNPHNGYINIFEFDKNMMYDRDKMNSDIEKYGLYSYEEFSDLISYEEFMKGPWRFYKVSEAKGKITSADIRFLLKDAYNSRAKQGVKDDLPSTFPWESSEFETQTGNGSHDIPTDENPLKDIFIPSTASLSSGANNDGSNDDDNGQGQS